MIPSWLTDTVTPDLDRALHYTLFWGLEGMEVRTMGRARERVPHINEERLRRRIRESEVPVVAVIPGMFEGAAVTRAIWMNEVLQLEETLLFCSRIGCPRVVVSAFAIVPESTTESSPVDALRQAGEAAARRGIRLAVLNEQGMAVETGAALAALLDTVDHPAVRAAWDPVAAVQAGEDPQAGLDALSGRVELVRCANIIREDNTWLPAPLAEGIVEWSTQLHHLQATGFDGPVSLTITMEPAPKWGLRQATELIRLLREARQVKR